MSNPDEPKPRSLQERRIQGFNAELAKANATLEHPDILSLPIAVIEQALATRNAVEWLLAEVERRAQRDAAETQQKREAQEEKERLWQARLESEPALRREVERRRESDEFQKKLGRPLKDHGPWPPPPRAAEQK